MGDLCLDVTRRYGVAASETGPLDSQTLAEVDDGGLAAIVHSLQLGNVDNAAAHRRSGDKTTSGEVLERLAVNGCLLLLLATEVCASRLGTPHHAVDVDSHDLASRLNAAIDEGTILPCNTRVGDKYVQSTVELLDNIIDGFVNGLGGDDVDLVRLALGTV